MTTWSQSEAIGNDHVPCDTLFVGARVIDPETNLDAVTNVGVKGGQVVHVGDSAPSARETVDVEGQVLAPGFIDAHSHTQSVAGLRVRALDGVTTALELEAGAFPVRTAYESAEASGRPINFGFSCSWALARVAAFEQVDLVRAAADVEDPSWMLGKFGHLSRWREPKESSQVRLVLGLLEEQMRDGGIGIGLMLGYLPDTWTSEYVEVADLAARSGMPTFTHTRFISKEEPNTSLDGILELIAAGAGTGAHMHICHLNSSSHRMIDTVIPLVTKAQDLGVNITTEAYPYGSGSTEVGAPFLHPENLSRIGIDATNIFHLPTSERIESVARLRQLRDQNPSDLVIFDWLDERNQGDMAMLARSFMTENTVVASDAMPLTRAGDPDSLGHNWPLPPDTFAHPRTAGSYGRIFRWLVRESGLMALPEAVRRCSLLPAQTLEGAVPDMTTKGRVQTGSDADLVIFDPETISDRATPTHPLQASAGIEHVLVGGTFVVRNRELETTAMPGRPLYGALKQ